MPYDARSRFDNTGSRPLIEIDQLRVEFRTRNGVVTAVQDVSLDVAKGETLGICRVAF